MLLLKNFTKPGLSSFAFGRNFLLYAILFFLLAPLHNMPLQMPMWHGGRMALPIKLFFGEAICLTGNADSIIVVVPEKDSCIHGKC